MYIYRVASARRRCGLIPFSQTVHLSFHSDRILSLLRFSPFPPPTSSTSSSSSSILLFRGCSHGLRVPRATSAPRPTCRGQLNYILSQLRRAYLNLNRAPRA